MGKLIIYVAAVCTVLVIMCIILVALFTIIRALDELADEIKTAVLWGKQTTI